jgi:hypothetical protein
MKLSKLDAHADINSGPISPVDRITCDCEACNNMRTNSKKHGVELYQMCECCGRFPSFQYGVCLSCSIDLGEYKL